MIKEEVQPYLNHEVKIKLNIAVKDGKPLELEGKFEVYLYFDRGCYREIYTVDSLFFDLETIVSISDWW